MSSPMNRLTSGATAGIDAHGPANPRLTARSVGPMDNPYVRYLRHWWWLLLIGLLLGSGGTFAYLRYGPRPYTSSAYVQVVPPSDMTAADAKALVDNTIAQAKSPLTRVLVSQALRGKVNPNVINLDTLANTGKLTVVGIDSTDFISITVTDTKPAEAQLIADTYAKTFVTQVDTQYKTELVTQQKQLQQQIDSTEQQLITAQLQQRQQDLNSQIRDQRAQLLSVQGNYLQMLQSQSVAEKLTPGSSGPALDPAAVKAAADQQAKMEGTLQATIAQLQGQLDDVNKQLAAAPGSNTVAAEQAQLNALLAQQQQGQQQLATWQQQQAQAASRPVVQPSTPTGPSPAQLAQQIATVQAKLSAANVYRQKLTLEAKVHDLQVQLVSALPAQQPSLRTQLADAQNQLAGATNSYAASGFTEFTPANIDVSINVLQQQLTSLLNQQAAPPPQPAAAPAPQSAGPPPQVPDLSGQIAALQAKIASSPDVAPLLNQQQALQGQLATAKSQLFQLQQSDIARLASTPAVSATAPPSPSANQQTTSGSNDVRNQWQQQAITEQTEIQKSINDLTTELTQVQAALAKVPSGTDLTLMATMADSYSKRLHTLSDQFVQVSNDQNGPGPVQAYGSASVPLSASGTKKTLGMGVGGGLAVAAAIAYAIDWWKRPRPLKVRVTGRTLRPGWPSRIDGVSIRDLAYTNGRALRAVGGLNESTLPDYEDEGI